MIKHYRILTRNYRSYTKSIGVIFRVIIAGIFLKLGNLGSGKFGVKMKKIANYFCSHESIFKTSFGKYLCSSLQEYVLMDKNYESEIGKIINKITDKKDTEKYLINIGCNIGRRAIDLAKNYNYKVIAFEPAPHTYYSLMVNIALSGLLNQFETYNVALGNDNTTLKFEYRKYHNGSSHIIDNNEQARIEGGEIIKVPVKRFDDLGIEMEKIGKTRLIIMDVEGFEINALQGMVKTLKKVTNINIIIEIQKQNINRTMNYMKSLGFSYSQIDEENWLFKK